MKTAPKVLLRLGGAMRVDIAEPLKHGRWGSLKHLFYRGRFIGLTS